MLEQTAENGASLQYASDEWRAFADAADARFIGLPLDPAAGSDRSFAQLLPGDFVLSSELAVFGAAIEPLPRPTVEVKYRHY
jgi:hypothetical protein